MKKYLIITILFSFITALTFASPVSNTVAAASEKTTFVKAGPGQQDRDRDRDRDRRGRERRERREHRHHHGHHHPHR